VQRRLGIDLGLTLGQPLPPLNSTRAVDITRRLMTRAAQTGASDHALETASHALHRRLSDN
jgi:hypothetical protein